MSHVTDRFGSSIVRRNRRSVAALLVAILAFMQVGTAAHACTILNPISQPAPSSAVQAMPADCPGMAEQTGSTVNVCESHCVGPQQIDAQADALTAPIAPQPALMVRLPDSCTLALTAAPAPSTIGAARSVLLRFSRLLI
jgi:hypothetical protein